MKLYQLTTTAIITLVSIISNPLESFSQKKFFIPPALGQDSWVNSPTRIEITKKTSLQEINYKLIEIDTMRKYNAPVSEADKKAIIEDLEKIEALRKSRNLIINYICSGYNIAEAWEKAVKACERSLRKGDDPDIFHPIHEAYFGAKKYNKAINSLKQSLNSDNNNYPFVSYQKLGLMYFKLGDYPEAIRQYQKAVESIKKSYEGYNCEACIHD
ncbi:TPR repeat [Trichodesmium erythraeum IMS101]|uniref:TPR repeat n=1 Tax=Trichodesmium erythraeum (strain IMS101) TaxID=203124 RepID=Q117R0_TRIEI|nr:tetratricopeptide repeat protein [Trichodesmium erythraeum GBRTRLIN201]